MGARLKIITVGTALAGVAWFAMPLLKTPGNAIRPDVVQFTVHYKPGTGRGGPSAVAASYQVGVIDDTATITHSPWTDQVVAAPGALVIFTATPAKSHDGHDVTSYLECWAHYKGKQIGHDRPRYPAKGCGITAHVPLVDPPVN